MSEKKKYKNKGKKVKQEPIDRLAAPLLNDKPKPAYHNKSFGAKLRNYFLTGLVIVAPLGITAYITWWFIELVDDWIKPWIPTVYNPDNYLPFSLPGVGLIAAILGIALLGFFAANLFGKSIVDLGEGLLNRMPVVRTIYNAVKQIFETVISQSSNSFKDVAIIEYPRRGIFAIVFISTNTRGEVLDKVGGGEGMVSVFLPTTPNPTSGFLLFVPVKDVILLDMSIEEAAKLVISAGLVVPDNNKKSDEDKGDKILTNYEKKILKDKHEKEVS